MTTTKLFGTKDLEKEDYPYRSIHNWSYDTGRWEDFRFMILEDNAGFWRIPYSEGLTENQYQGPWEDWGATVEGVLVEEKEVTVKRWVPVD